jgi:hypothetical protein
LLAKDAGSGERHFKLQKVLDSVVSTTQVAGNMKGIDEREMMFGKLFGCLAIVRSGRLAGDSQTTSAIFNHLCELYLSKVWMREAAVEAIIHLVASLTGNETVIAESIIPKLWILLTQPAHTIALGTFKATSKLDSDAHTDWFGDSSNLQSMSPAQICLRCGLQSLQLAPLSQILPTSQVINEMTFENIVETLLVATAGYPKVCKYCLLCT